MNYKSFFVLFSYVKTLKANHAKLFHAINSINAGVEKQLNKWLDVTVLSRKERRKKLRAWKEVWSSRGNSSALTFSFSRISWCNLIPLEEQGRGAHTTTYPYTLIIRGKASLSPSFSLPLSDLSSLLGPIFSLASPTSISFSLGFAHLLSAYIPSSLLHSHLLVTLTPCAPLNERGW